MEYLDDDAFGALAYEEEEFEQDLQTKTHPQKGSDEILPELSDDDEDIELAAVDSAKENHQQNVQPEEHMARKRGPIGVFNDYSPIDWHMRIGDEEGQAKRRRLELEEAVGRATMRILAARTAARRQQQQQQRRPNDAATGDDILGKTSSLPQTTRKNKMLRVPPMNGQIWWGINSVDGTFRRYLSTRRHQDRESALAKFAVQLADDDASLAKLVLAEERVHEREQQHNQSPLKDDVDVQMVDVDLTKKVKKGPSTSALWTDKYAPRTFLDLLTEDETNRTVLLWLRLWDEFVFGNRGHKGIGHDSNRKGSNNPASSLWDTLEERDKTFFEMERPKGTESSRPKAKMYRFWHFFGPSGVGKSSLARVAALQAGYSPVIIPISEFQNVAELKSRLENATDSTSIDALFHNLAIASSSEAAVGTRPCCFIVDAVEQASSEMVQFLCSWVRRSRISSSSTAATIRRRPVICTCASLWNAPSLRELRVNCLPVRVQRCNRERMQRRLEQVCHSEGVLIGRDHLDELLLSHGSDIRLCLNTLQFSTVKTAKLSSKTFSSTNFAFTRTAADQRATPCAVPSPVNTAVTASLFDTLSAIFTLDYHEDNRCIVRPPPSRARALQTLFGQMPSDDFGRLQQLVFNNFATALKLNMAQCRFVSVMFTECDALQTLLRQAQHFVLARYIPFALALVHFHCALRVSRRLQFNLAVLPFVEQQRENLQIARSLRASACTGNRYVGLGDLFTWFAPLLWLVLQPPVKPSLWADGGGGQEQRQLIQRVVELMRSFRIGLVRTTGADGMARFTFEPAFHSLVRFPVQSLPSANESRTVAFSAQLISEPVKQYIAHQLERAPAAKMGRDECEDVSGSKDHANQIQQHWTAGPRPASPSSSPSSSSFSANAPLFTYQHSAGSSQAVRREIRIGTLFSAFQH
uniref:AAA domain-containing protein n=1 Tax=Globodera pallida TaxID=36090 RepID=A0A183CPD9_GLOPA